MSFKETFPNEDVLKEQLQAAWGHFDAEIKAAVGLLEAEYTQVKRRQKIGTACIVGMALLLGSIEWFFDSDIGITSILGDVAAVILGILFLPLLIFLGVAGYRLLRDKNAVVRRFNMGINRLMFPKVLQTFGLNGSYVEVQLGEALYGKELADMKEKVKKNKATMVDTNSVSDDIFKALQRVASPQVKQVTDLLDHSELVTEPRNRVEVDDMITIDWQGRTLFLSELDLKHVTGSGKNRQVKKIFSGYFVSLDLQRTLSGKTFVSTEGDKKGFGHQSFWKNLKGKEVEVTELEWNDFENLLHVATTDPTEARYVLTTDFMSDLYDWWKAQADNKKKRGNIRIAFIESRMYMLFPDKNIRFTNTIPKIENKELQDYAMTIAAPLMHVLHLAEDVKV